MELAGALSCVVVLVLGALLIGVAAALAAHSQKRAEVWDAVAGVRDAPPRAPAPHHRSPARSPRRQDSEPKRKTAPGSARWVRPGERIQVAGRSFEAPWAWFGRGLEAAGNRWGTEAALIDPSLPVDLAHADHDGERLGYWPQYDAISPQCRAAFLLWLEGGRADPDASIGYVFLYYYGLERRLLMDLLPLGREQPEVAEIVSEVDRLRAIYGHNGSFDGYSSRLLEFVRAGELAQQDPATADPPLHSMHWEPPLGLRVALGKLLAGGKRISAEWALAWGLHHHSVGKRTPVTRCRDEVIELFKLRFDERYSGGLKIKAPKRRIKVEYRTASPSLRLVDCTMKIDLPDVGALSAPLNKVHAVLDQCCDELASYSRWVGRNPERAGSLHAAALLPSDLMAQMDTPSLAAFRAWLELATTRGGEVRAQELLAPWQTVSAGKWAKKDSVLLGQLLEGHGFGVEPDVRFGGARLDKATTLVLFELADEILDTPSPAYLSATLALHLATAVVHADGVVDTQEEEDLERLLERNLHLSAAERRRLRAHLRWLLLDHPGMRGLSTRLKALPERERAALAHAMAGIATAGGGAGPSELKLLAKVYKLLGQDPSELYEHVHRAQSSADSGPVTVRRGRAKPAGHAIPDQPTTAATSAPPGFELDLDLVADRVAETERVHGLLGDIFEDEAQDTAPSSAPTASNGDAEIDGLDTAHSALVRVLLTQPTWSLEAAEAEADALGLILGGALETINDAAYDHCDAPLIEGDDEFEIDPDVAAELCP